jgi:dihydrofolate reductase
MLYSIILACTLEGGIGYNNIIPWDIKSELYLFKQITTGCVDNFKSNAVIMGRKTWESLKYKPLKDRINIIITKDANSFKYDNLISFADMDKAFEYCERNVNIDKVFVIGGKSIYDLCLDKYADNIEYIYLSVIYKYFYCNKFINIRNILSNYEAINENVIFHPQFLHMKMKKKEKRIKDNKCQV